MTKLVTPQAEKAFSFPVGAVSPLWLMFAGAAAAGAAVFWARQWLKPTNLEALTPLRAPVAEPVIEAVETTVEAAEEVVEAAPEVAPEVVAVAAEAVEETVEAAAEVVEAVAEPVVEAAPEVVETIAETVEAVADDLTRLTGIGPKLAASLAERGVTRFLDIAAWTAADVEKFDKDMKLMGRIDREAWIAQAKRYAEAAVH